MGPPTTTHLLLTTSLLIMMLTTSLAHPISCTNETDREAVSFNPTIQIFTSSGPESHLNDTIETRLLDVLERMETRQDQLTVALARLLPRDCSDVLAAGRSESGVYLIQPNRAPEAFRVYCDMTTDGGGWTVFQRRQSGNVDFFRRWSSYKLGFGDIENEFWIGNDVLHLLTNDRAMQLRVDLWSFDNETAYAEYSSFSVSDESDYYRLEIGGYQGTASDSMRYHNGGAFTTRDEDHDTSSRNCATLSHGAWWYRFCGYSNLNGRYYIDGATSEEYDGITWLYWKGNYVSMKKTEMKVRPL